MRMVLPAPVAGVPTLVDLYAELSATADTPIQLQNVSNETLYVYAGDALPPVDEYNKVEPDEWVQLSAPFVSVYSENTVTIVAHEGSGRSFGGSGSGSTSVKNSIEEDAGDLQLVGDLASPGNDYMYGTSGAGVKGWRVIPVAGAEVNDLAANVTWTDVPDINITESSVTQHTAAVVTTSAVTTAGALMDSEVDADIKTLVLPASTTISTFGATLVDDADESTARATLGVDAAASKSLKITHLGALGSNATADTAALQSALASGASTIDLEGLDLYVNADQLTQATYIKIQFINGKLTCTNATVGYAIKFESACEVDLVDVEIDGAAQINRGLWMLGGKLTTKNLTIRNIGTGTSNAYAMMLEGVDSYHENFQCFDLDSNGIARVSLLSTVADPDSTTTFIGGRFEEFNSTDVAFDADGIAVDSTGGNIPLLKVYGTSFKNIRKRFIKMNVGRLICHGLQGYNDKYDMTRAFGLHKFTSGSIITGAYCVSEGASARFGVGIKHSTNIVGDGESKDCVFTDNVFLNKGTLKGLESCFELDGAVENSIYANNRAQGFRCLVSGLGDAAYTHIGVSVDNNIITEMTHSLTQWNNATAVTVTNNQVPDVELSGGTYELVISGTRGSGCYADNPAMFSERRDNLGLLISTSTDIASTDIPNNCVVNFTAVTRETASIRVLSGTPTLLHAGTVFDYETGVINGGVGASNDYQISVSGGKFYLRNNQPSWLYTDIKIIPLNDEPHDIPPAGDVFKVNTPADEEIGIWTGDGTIEGRDAAGVRTLLNVEDGSTADQTGAEIKSAYEGEANAFTDAQFTKLAGIETGATADQTGAQIKTAYENEADTNAYDDAAESKLAGIAASATANDTDANLKNRANHTGTQTLATISDAGTLAGLNSASLAVNVTSNLPVTHLNNGTNATNATFWRGDATWKAPEGTGILSTGEVGGTKFLREDGDGSCSWQAIGGGGDALVANGLDQFAATTSAELAGVISDETGTGAVVFATSPTLVTPALGTPSALVGTNITGTATSFTASNVTTNANLTGHITSSGSNATTLGSFTKAQLNTALSDGSVVPDYAVPALITGTTDTLAAADHGLTNRYNNAAQVTVTIPTDASDDLPDGYWCALFAEGAGGLTLSTTGITLAGASPNTTIIQNECLFVQKTSAADTWLVIGGTAA